MTPDYFGIPRNTLLARAMFDGDYLGKRLANQPRPQAEVPPLPDPVRVRTHPIRSFIAITRPSGCGFPWPAWMWPSPPDGKTFSFEDAGLRFNLREQLNHQDLPAQANGYDELLTSLMGDFEGEYPHDPRVA